MQMIKAELVLWVAGFVLLSLIVNAPLLPWIMHITKLNIGTLNTTSCAIFDDINLGNSTPCHAHHQIQHRCIRYCVMWWSWSLHNHAWVMILLCEPLDCSHGKVTPHAIFDETRKIPQCW